MSSPTKPESRLLTEVEAADFLNRPVRTLQGLRVRGGGPAFVKMGRSVRYRLSDLDAYVAAGLRASTSETTVREGAR